MRAWLFPEARLRLQDHEDRRALMRGDDLEEDEEPEEGLEDLYSELRAAGDEAAWRSRADDVARRREVPWCRRAAISAACLALCSPLWRGTVDAILTPSTSTASEFLRVAGAGSGALRQQLSQDAGSCAQFGCHSDFDPSRPCQCNDACVRYASCCSDFDNLCAGEPAPGAPPSSEEGAPAPAPVDPAAAAAAALVAAAAADGAALPGDLGSAPDAAPSCARFGCTGFQPENPCQCNPECVDHDSCCLDFADRCQATSAPPAASTAQEEDPTEQRETDPAQEVVDVPETPTEPEPQEEELVTEPPAATTVAPAMQADPVGTAAPAAEASAADDGSSSAHGSPSREVARTRLLANPGQSETGWPTTRCAQLAVGDHVEVRDGAIVTWLPGTVTSVNPVMVRPDGWRYSFAWRAFRQSGTICSPAPEQMRERKTTEECHTAHMGEPCFEQVLSAAEDAKVHPQDYPGLVASPTLPQMQDYLHINKLGSCGPPCQDADATRPTCLCLFDIDRTLTSSQDADPQECPGTKRMTVTDTAFQGGSLVLSDLAMNLKSTFCGECLRGIVSMGTASGSKSKMRQVLQDVLGGAEWTLSDTWSQPAPNVSSMLVIGSPDLLKQETVRGIVDWLAKEKGVRIQDKDVFFFDDNAGNTPPFAGSAFNARQVSCSSRGKAAPEKFVGYCGARAEEVVNETGVQLCPKGEGEPQTEERISMK